MEPEEFAAAIQKLWKQFCGGVFTFALIVFHAICVASLWLWHAMGKVYARVCAHVDVILTTGWRKLWGWLGLAVGVFTYLYAPTHHLAVDAANANYFLGFCTLQYFGRGAEKLISIGALRIPGMGGWSPVPDSPEDGPRPVQA